ncbi:MAG: division/cell wall cluster transcriptional repressor MraZ [Acidimicrobiia bacterium]
MEASGASGDAQPGAGGPGAGPVVDGARPPGPRVFVGSYEHSVDDKNRLVLPAPYRTRLAVGAYLGPLDGFLGLWPDDTFDSVLSTWSDGVGLGIVSQELFDAFMAATYFVQPDGQGRIVVHRNLLAFAGIEGPVMVAGARERVAVWARDRWDQRQEAIPGGPSEALRQAARDLKL